MATNEEESRRFAEAHGLLYEQGWELQYMAGPPEDPTYLIDPYNVRIASEADEMKTAGFPFVLGVTKRGRTGWNYRLKVALHVLVADFDVDTDGKRTPRTISIEERDRLIRLLSPIEELELKFSGGGNGVHGTLYFDPDDLPDCEDRKQFSAIAQAALQWVEARVGEKLPIDKCGGVAWDWRRDPKPNSFEVIKPATATLRASDLPAIKIHNTETKPHQPLGPRHQANVDTLKTAGCVVEPVEDEECFKVHTTDLHLIDPTFRTISGGTDRQTPNAFMFPTGDGAWTVHRYGGAREHHTWRQVDGKTWTVLNPHLELDFGDRGEFVDLLDLTADHPDLHPPVIDGMVRKGEVWNIVSAPKIGKSWLSYGIALAVASGGKAFGKFPCRPGRVLLVDNELHRPTIAYRINAVAHAMELTLAREWITVVSLRGRNMDLYQIGERIIPKIEPGRFDLIVIDAWYKTLPAGVDENSNSDITRMYGLLDNFALKTDSAIVVVHHSSKGDQSGKDVVDVGAGAGSQARAADVHSILRHHEEDGHLVLESRPRSFVTPEPVVLRWNFPLWVPTDLDPGALRDPKTKKQRENDEAGSVAIVTALKSSPMPVRGIMSATNMGRDRVSKLLGRLANDHVIDYDEESRGNKRTRVYRLLA